jgi:hypothetical protein
VPVSVPGEQVGVFLEALGEVLLAEPLEDGWVGRVGLTDELRGRIDVLLLTPVNSDLRLGGLRLLCCCNGSTSPGDDFEGFRLRST